MKKLALLLCVATLLANLMTSCAFFDAAKLAQQSPTPIATADMSGRGPGSLVSAMSMPNIDMSIRSIGAKAVRVVYRSTSGIDGTPTEVSGAVFIPVGHPPKDGWPIIAYAHGTSGILEGCGPSLSPDIYGAASTIAQYLKLGFAVAAADYQGLGHAGFHTYLDAKTAGLNVIDAVRALKAVSQDVGKTWAAFGGSQGGGATWAANEQAGSYAPELELVGSVSLSPVADVVGVVQLASERTLTKEQIGAYLWVLAGLEHTYPGFNIDDYRRGVAKEKWDVLQACFGPPSEERARLIEAMSPDDLTPASPGAADELRGLLEKLALPQQRADSPMLVIYGGLDQYINARWTAGAVERACGLGDTILALFQPDKGHGDVDGSAFVQWLGERFERLPAPNNCPASEPAIQPSENSDGN